MVTRLLPLQEKQNKKTYLREIRSELSLLNRHDIEMGTKPLRKTHNGAVLVDNVGGETLGWLTRTTHVWGNIASIGLAGGYKIKFNCDAVYFAWR